MDNDEEIQLYNIIVPVGPRDSAPNVYVGVTRHKELRKFRIDWTVTVGPTSAEVSCTSDGSHSVITDQQVIAEFLAEPHLRVVDGELKDVYNSADAITAERLRRMLFDAALKRVVPIESKISLSVAFSGTRADELEATLVEVCDLILEEFDPEWASASLITAEQVEIILVTPDDLDPKRLQQVLLYRAMPSYRALLQNFAENPSTAVVEDDLVERLPAFVAVPVAMASESHPTISENWKVLHVAYESAIWFLAYVALTEELVGDRRARLEYLGAKLGEKPTSGKFVEAIRKRSDVLRKLMPQTGQLLWRKGTATEDGRFLLEEFTALRNRDTHDGILPDGILGSTLLRPLRGFTTSREP